MRQEIKHIAHADMRHSHITGAIMAAKKPGERIHLMFTI